MDMLETRELTKVFPPPRLPVRRPRDVLLKLLGRERGEPVLALDRVSMKVTQGELFGLLGPNGAGKTTLCKILNAVVLPTSGSATIAGLDVIKEHREITSKVFGMFGGEIEMHGLFIWRIDLEKNLRFLSKLWKVPDEEIQDRIDRALRILDLEEKRNEWYQRLSGGQRQKAWLACVLCVRPELCILDEPTIKLDARSRLDLYRTLREDIIRNLGGTVFITTHNLNEAEILCDRVAILDKGRLVAIDSPANLRRYVRKESVVELVIDQRRPELCASLRKVQGVLDCTLEEDADKGIVLRITADTESCSYNRIMAAVLASGVEVRAINSKPSSLEDAFLKLTAKGEEAAS